MTIIKDIVKAILYKPLFNLFIFLVAVVPGQNVGVGVILLTILVRIALYPTNASMIRSQRAMQAIQPEVDRIREEFKDDQAAQSKALMELYQAKQINPFSSCVVLLIQLPILWMLYKVFTVGLNTDRFDLLYAFTPRPDHMTTMFLGADLALPSILLGVVAGVVQFAQSYQMMASQPKKPKGSKVDPTAALTQNMLYIFPVLTVVISLKLPAALALYWITTTVAMIVQQWWMHRQHTDVTKDVARITVRSPKS